MVRISPSQNSHMKHTKRTVQLKSLQGGHPFLLIGPCKIRLTLRAVSSAGRSPGTSSLWAGKTYSAWREVALQCSVKLRRICSHTQGQRLAHTQAADCIKSASGSVNKPELNVEHRRVWEIRHTFNVQDLLDLSSTVYYRFYCLSVDVQLCRRQSRIPIVLWCGSKGLHLWYSRSKLGLYWAVVVTFVGFINHIQ